MRPSIWFGAVRYAGSPLCNAVSVHVGRQVPSACGRVGVVSSGTARDHTPIPVTNGIVTSGLPVWPRRLWRQSTDIVSGPG